MASGSNCDAWQMAVDLKRELLASGEALDKHEEVDMAPVGVALELAAANSAAHERDGFLFAADGESLSFAGAYLASLVVYRAITGAELPAGGAGHSARNPRETRLRAAAAQAAGEWQMYGSNASCVLS